MSEENAKETEKNQAPEDHRNLTSNYPRTERISNDFFRNNSPTSLWFVPPTPKKPKIQVRIRTFKTEE